MQDTSLKNGTDVGYGDTLDNNQSTLNVSVGSVLSENQQFGQKAFPNCFLLDTQRVIELDKMCAATL